MFYVYVLRSLKDNKLYTGFSSDVHKRLEEHNLGKVLSTKYRRPFNLIYFEFCLNKFDAIRREKYLKTTYGKRYLYSRLKEYFDE